MDETTLQKLSSLIAERITKDAADSLSSRLDSYIEMDAERHRNLEEFRVQSSALLAETAAILKEVRCEVNSLKEECPKRIERIAKLESSQKSTTWLIRAIMGVTVLASLGGVIGGVNSCYGNREAAAATMSQAAEMEKGR